MEVKLKAIQGFNACLDSPSLGLSVRNDPLVCESNHDTWVVEILPIDADRITILNLTKREIEVKLTEMEVQLHAMLELLARYDEPS